MGTWGAGIFDNDEAREYLDEIMQQLVSKIRNFYELEGQQDEFGQDYFTHENASGYMLPSIDILITLCQRYHTKVDLSPDEIAGWKEKLLRYFDDHVEYLGKKEYVVARRMVIDNTFDELIALCWN